MAAAFLGPQTDRETLIEFYRKVRPFGPGWAPIRAVAEMSSRPRPPWVAATRTCRWRCSAGSSGCTSIWSALFCVGNYLYGRNGYALALLAVFVASGLSLIGVVRRAVGVNGPGSGIRHSRRSETAVPSPICPRRAAPGV